MPKYCKCATNINSMYLNTGSKYYNKNSSEFKKVRNAFGGNVFLYPGTTQNLQYGKYYALVRPSAHGLNETTRYWVKPGGTWIDQSKYKKAELIKIPKSGYQCYDQPNVNSHKTYKILYDSTKFNNYEVMALPSENKSGWYQLLWPELWGKTSEGYFKKATSTSPGSTEVGEESTSRLDESSVTGSSGGTTELTGSEEIVLTEEELRMIDKALESTLQDSLKRENVFGVNYIIGSPFQFLPSADHRVYKAADEKVGESVYRNYSNYKLGRSYTENIIVEAPIVYFLPGEPSFMAGWDKAEKDVITNYISSRNNEGTEDFSKLMAQYDEDGKDFGRFYDFKGKYSEYMGCVNLLCRAAAVFIGIGDKIVPSQPANDSTNFAGDQYYKNYDWRNWGRTITLDGTVEEMSGDVETEGEEEAVEKVGIFNIINKVKTFAGNVLDNLTENASEFLDTTLGDNGYFKCYMDPSSSASEDVSNDTKTSQIAGLFDSISDLYKEAEYLLQDSGVISGLANTAADALSTVTASAGSVLSSTGFGNFGKLLGLGSQVLQGSNIAFPDMWGDSNYSRSYNITVNLVSPYGDTESIFLNTIMPMLHLLALGLPRQTSANSFTAPFIVRAFSPGIFSCDLGLVTGITVNKCPNGTDAYNVMGLPSELQVQLTIRDLYSQLSMTPAHSKSTPFLFYNNQGLIDFLGVICGLNFAHPTIIVRIKALWSIITNMVLDFPGEVYYDLLNNLANRTRGLAGMK